MPPSPRRRLPRLLAALSSPGGHLALLFALFVIGIGMEAAHLAKGEDVVIGVLGALLMALTGGGGRTPPPPVCPYGASLFPAAPASTITQEPR